MSLRRLLAAASLGFALAATGVRAETLPLPANLVDFRSPDGEKLLRESGPSEAFFPLIANFVTQKTLGHCGIASIVMVLNALQLPAPSVPEYKPYRIFTQDNFFSDATERILPVAVFMKQGTTLDQLGGLLALYPLKVEVHHAADTSLDAFRAGARDHLARKDHFVLVNYLRKAMGQEIGGHISPLASYDADTDRFLILDVARYKYPPVWVTASDLFNAMNTIDADNEDKTRGFVLIERATEATASSAN